MFVFFSVTWKVCFPVNSPVGSVAVVIIYSQEQICLRIAIKWSSNHFPFAGNEAQAKPKCAVAPSNPELPSPIAAGLI